MTATPAPTSPLPIVIGKLPGDETIPLPTGRQADLEAAVLKLLHQHYPGYMKLDGTSLRIVLTRAFVRYLLERTRGSQVRAAQISGMNRNTLRKLVRMLGIDWQAIQDRNDAFPTCPEEKSNIAAFSATPRIDAPPPIALEKGEYLIDGEVYVGIGRVADLLSISASYAQYIKNRADWREATRPGCRSRTVYLKDDVLSHEINANPLSRPPSVGGTSATSPRAC